MVAAIRRSAPFFLVLVDDDGRGGKAARSPVRRNSFSRTISAARKAVAAVGERVFGVKPGLLGQVGLDDRQQPLDVGRLGGRERNEFAKAWRACIC